MLIVKHEIGLGIVAAALEIPVLLGQKGVGLIVKLHFRGPGAVQSLKGHRYHVDGGIKLRAARQYVAGNVNRHTGQVIDETDKLIKLGIDVTDREAY